METLTVDSNAVARSPSNPAPADPQQSLLEHWQGVYLLCLRITDDTHAAEDLVQDAYVRALGVVNSERPDNPRTWLFCIAANLAKNWLRDRKTHRRVEQKMAAETPMHTPAESSEKAEAAPALQKHFRGLEEKYRVALSLHYEQGLSYREVAAVLQKPEGTAATLITRGIGLLRESLSREGHSIAPAVLALELQKSGATALARPELLTALKAALAAKSAGATAAGAAAAKGGAAIFTTKTALVAGGLALAASAFIAMNHFSAPRVVTSKLVAAPVVTPIAGVPANPVRKGHYLDSNLAFSVEEMTDSGDVRGLGETPGWNEAGVRLPENDNWMVAIRSKNPEEVLAELRQKQIPGVDLSNSDVPLNAAFFTELAKLPLKTLKLADGNPQHLAELRGMKSLERLVVQDSKTLSDAAWADIATHPNLRVLLARGPVSDTAAAQLLKLTKLEVVSVQPTVKGFELLSKLPQLANLDVRASDVLDVDLLASPAPLPPKLKELSLGRSTEKLMELAELRKALSHVRVNGWNPLADADPKQKALADEEKDDLIAFENAQHDPNAALPSENSELNAVLNNRLLTVDFVDTSLQQALTQIADHSGTRIVMDPALPNSDGQSHINLRVSDMNCALALSWVLKLSDLDFVKIGHIVLVTTNKRATQAVNPKTRDVALPANPDEKPWTLEETQALAQTVSFWSGVCHAAYAVNSDKCYGLKDAQMEHVCTATAPGALAVTGSAAERIDELVRDFQDIPPRVIIPRWIQQVEEKLDMPLTIGASPTAKGRTLEWACSALAKGLQVPLMLDPKIVKAGTGQVLIPESWPVKGATGRSALLELCAYAKLCVGYRSDVQLMVLSKMPDVFGELYPVMLDLRPALKAGAPAAELAAALKKVNESSGVAATTVRGRWMALTDPWTARRAAAVIDTAAKSGKVSQAPVPWFFETRGYANVESPKPPADDGYDGKGF
jgi:RNA polymerase sigma-70 factor (ECF subfamily)